MSSRGYNLEPRNKAKTRWRVTVAGGWNSKTKEYDRHRETFYAKTKTEASRIAEKIRDRALAGYGLDASKVTFQEYADEYMESKRGEWEESTYYGYKNKIGRHAYSRVGGDTLASFTRVKIDRLYAEIIKQDKISAKTLRIVHSVLNPTFRRAVKHGLLPFNPADMAELPKLEKKEKQALEVADTALLLNLIERLETYTDCTALRLNECDARNLAIALAIGLETGVRRCEACGFRWGDFDGSLMEAKRAYKRMSRGKVDYGDLKTRGSKRGMAATSSLMTRLESHKAWQEKYFTILEINRDGDTPILTDVSGNPLSPDKLTKLVRRTFDKTGLEGYSYHSLRHTHITYLLMSDIPLKVVQERAGHASATTTLDEYGHVLQGQDEIAAQTFERVMQVTRKNHSPQILPKAEKKEPIKEQNPS